MNSFKDFVDATESGYSPADFPVHISSITRVLLTSDDDMSAGATLTELNIRSLAPAIAIGYILKDYNKSKSILARAKSAKTIEDRLREINQMLIINSRQNLVLVR